MITTRVPGSVALALLLGATPLAAQRAADVEPASPQQQPAGNAASATADPQSDAVAPKSGSVSKPAPDKTNDSPFDYRSSEEISEDFSVSFPVDI